ncbi:Znf/thioredoxin_put domain-containing protein [Azospirillaceae bacterium]
MILTCPACSTRYAIDPTTLGAAGRKVRCAKCNHNWIQRPVAEPPKAVDFDPTESTALMEQTFSFETSPFAEPPPTPSWASPSTLAKSAPPPPSRPLVAGWMMMFALTLVIVSGLVLGRTQIVGVWPPAARLYDVVGLPVDPPGAGLKIQNVRSEQRVEDGTALLLVEGQVANVSSLERDVPAIRAISIGPDGKEVRAWIVPPSLTRLMPGEVATFSSIQRDPGTIAQVRVTFEGR